MEYLKFSRGRIVASAALVLLGITLRFSVSSFWPDAFTHSLEAFVAAGICAAAFVLMRGAYGVVRSALLSLTILAALSWTAIAYSDIAQLFAAVVYAFKEWKAAGAVPIACTKAAFGVLSSLSPSQMTGYWTALFVGSPPVLFCLFGTAFVANQAEQNRVSRNGPWSAHWMFPNQVRYLQSRAVGIPLGLSGGDLLRYEPDPAKGWRGGHHLAIAGTRAGKGVSVVIPAIIDHDGPVVCLDVKGENFAVTRRHRESLGRRVLVLNPFGVIEASKDGFNPLDYIRPNHLVRDIDVIAEGLVRPETGAGAHFSEIARQLIAAAIEVVMTQSDIADRNLNTVMDLLLFAGLEDRLEVWACRPEQFGRRPAQAAASLLSAGENERGAIKTTIKKSFEWARSDEMRSFLVKSAANLDDLLDDRIDVFIAVPLDQLDAQSVFMRLVINIVLGTVVRQDGRRIAEKRILMVLDEFVRLGRMEKLLNIANVAAGAGIEALFITQDKGQIETIYGKGDTDSLLGSCVTTRIFGLGRLESHTAEWASNAIGDKTVLTRSSQTPNNMGDRSRVSKSEQRQKLMTADQILEMPANQILCLIGSKSPLRINSVVSHAHPAYRSKLDPNPTRRA